uniref:J domain-containing protein n=1 Tax=Chenopodium quinoa TaxID=63459 RepID=A0A803M0T5_CHEQI
MAATEKRCYYEVLGLQQSCTQDEIRSAYKKLALQRHPDKLIQSGIASADATAAFQELVRAYEILSDPKERSWYDSHRSQILFSSNSGSDSNSNSDSPFPDLFSYFSPSCYTDYTNPKTGFYKVYGDVFDKIYAHEIKYCRLMGLNLGLVKEAPLLGDLKCDYSQVNAFYGYWLGFSTVMDFGWVDKYDAAAGENRKSRRVMEEENKKVRKKAKREFNETVRGLAEFVKKRDKRFKSDKQWKNHEQSKKHKEKVAHLRKSFIEEDDFEDVEQVDVDGGIQHEDETEPVAKIVDDKNDVAGNVDSENVVIDDGFVSAEDDVDELEERFQESVGFEEGKSRYELPSDKEDGIGNDELNDIGQSPGGSDDESIDLEAMISGRWNKKHVTSKNESFERNNVQSEDDIEPMEYNNKKVKKKSRRAKKEKDKPFQAEPSRVGDNVTNVPVMENNGLSASDTANNADDDQVDHDPQTSTKAGKKSFGRKEKGTIKRDTETKPKNSCKGRKQKEKSKNLEPVCEKCGEEFESSPGCFNFNVVQSSFDRSKLHKHLSETGHATVKIR